MCTGGTGPFQHLVDDGQAPWPVSWLRVSPPARLPRRDLRPVAPREGWPGGTRSQWRGPLRTCTGLPDHHGAHSLGLLVLYLQDCAGIGLYVWHDGAVHLVPGERAHRNTIDDHRACEAIAGIGEPAGVAGWARRFDLLSEPGRLTLLLAVHAAGPISVTDLAVATGMSDTSVSQALRLLRTAGAVEAHKDGRVIRYRLSDPHVHDLLHHLSPRPASPH
jgi:DNA-binding transcriptional ArsR family regulator